MAIVKYRSRPDAMISALAAANITTVRQLASRSHISPPTARCVFNGDEVGMRTTIKVVRALQEANVDATLSDLFETVEP